MRDLLDQNKLSKVGTDGSRPVLTLSKMCIKNSCSISPPSPSRSHYGRARPEGLNNYRDRCEMERVGFFNSTSVILYCYPFILFNL
jgi:hypothetical protein